jgi:hypothetical protein
LKTRRTIFVRASRARRPSSRACEIRSSAFSFAAFIRAQTIRLVRDAREMILGGYRRLLAGR